MRVIHKNVFYSHHHVGQSEVPVLNFHLCISRAQSDEWSFNKVNMYKFTSFTYSLNMIINWNAYVVINSISR